jgi:hypothetical protein
LKQRYPDLADPRSEFFKLTADIYGPLYKAGMHAHAAMERAAQEAEAQFVREGKLVANQD